MGYLLRNLSFNIGNKNYGLETKLGYQFYKTAKTVEEVIDYKLGNKYTGIIPTEDTGGGIAGELQSPSSLLSWNLRPITITYSGVVDENGEFKIVSKVKKLTKEEYERLKKENPEEIPYINGVGNTIRDHADGRFIGALTPEEHEKVRKGEEIKEAVIRVQTAKEIETIATKDLTDSKVQAELGVEIEKFNPNDTNLFKSNSSRRNSLRRNKE